MIRNLKVLGLVLLAVFALGAVAASGASAENGKLTSDSSPVTLSGTQTGGEGANALSAFGLKTECESATYSGGSVTTPTETITITPSYGTCSLSGFPMTVDMNGCNYLFHLTGTDEHATDSYAITATVVCPTGNHIVMTIFGSAAKHTESRPFCEIEITEAPSYDGLHAVNTTNATPPDIDITGTINNISAHKRSPTGSILCPAETTTTASLTQDVTVKGSSAGLGVGIRVTDS